MKKMYGKPNIRSRSFAGRKSSQKGRELDFGKVHPVPPDEPRSETKPDTVTKTEKLEIGTPAYFPVQVKLTSETTTTTSQ